MFYWFTFSDGYRECARGYSYAELRVMERSHGKLLSKTPA